MKINYLYNLLDLTLKSNKGNLENISIYNLKAQFYISNDKLESATSSLILYIGKQT
jgi:hypothetical protein